MGKVVIEVPNVMNVNLKARDISDAIRKLLDLKVISPRKSTLKNIKRFKGIAKYKDRQTSKEEWYSQ